MSSLYEELDQLDRKLDGLEEEVDDVIDISNDDVMAQSIYDDYHARVRNDCPLNLTKLLAVYVY